MRTIFQTTAIFLSITTIAISTSTAQNRSGVQFTPSDFDPKKHILLVAEMPRLRKPDERNESATKQLDKALQANYPYKYEIVSMKDIAENPGKYADTAVYKYALLNSLSSYKHTTTTMRKDIDGIYKPTTSPSANITSIDFLFYDRVTGTRYPDSGWHSSFIGMTMKKVIGIIKKEKGL